MEMRVIHLVLHGILLVRTVCVAYGTFLNCAQLLFYYVMLRAVRG
jgi:hypothetical protein